MKFLVKPIALLLTSVSFLLMGCDPEPKNHVDVKAQLVSVPPVEWTRDKCGNRQYRITSRITVDDLVNNARFYAQEGKNSVPAKHFFFVHLDYKSIVDLHARLNSLRSEGDLFTTLTFDIRDYMIRLAINDPGAAAYFKSNVLVDNTAFVDLYPERSEFHVLAQSPVCPMGELAQASIFPHRTFTASPEKKRLRVFHGAMEAHNVRVGGVSSFVSGLVEAEMRHVGEDGERDIDGALVTPFYDVLKRKFLIVLNTLVSSIMKSITVGFVALFTKS